jgi:hypothetical protein
MVVVETQTNLLEVVAATHSSCGLSSRLDGRQKQANEDANDGNDDQKFHQRETAAHRFSTGHAKTLLNKKKTGKK